MDASPYFIQKIRDMIRMVHSICWSGIALSVIPGLFTRFVNGHRAFFTLGDGQDSTCKDERG